MNIKKQIRTELSKYLDTKLETGSPYIFNEVVNFIKRDRKKQLTIHGVSQQRELLNAFEECITEDNIVIVIDTSNYKASFSEEVPFKAQVIDKYDINTVVKSQTTGKEYELYDYQMIEGLEIEQIKNLLDISKYGL